MSPEGPTTPAREDSARPLFVIKDGGDEVDQLFGRANPNPSRIGCPPDEILVSLARRERPIDHPGYEHLRTCSPCYLEVRAIQEEDKRAGREKRFRVLGPAAAALLVVGLGIGLWYSRSRESAGAGVAAPRKVTLDLRPYAAMRGESRSTLPPLGLPRAPVAITMLLPNGSEPGAYEVRIMSADGSVRATGTGSATIEARVATLRATLDLAQVLAGNYQMGVRKPPDEWQSLPVDVR